MKRGWPETSVAVGRPLFLINMRTYREARTASGGHANG
jgi:hypothetical protein